MLPSSLRKLLAACVFTVASSAALFAQDVWRATNIPGVMLNAKESSLGSTISTLNGLGTMLSGGTWRDYEWDAYLLTGTGGIVSQMGNGSNWLCSDGFIKHNRYRIASLYVGEVDPNDPEHFINSTPPPNSSYGAWFAQKLSWSYHIEANGDSSTSPPTPGVAQIGILLSSQLYGKTESKSVAGLDNDYFGSVPSGGGQECHDVFTILPYVIMEYTSIFGKAGSTDSVALFKPDLIKGAVTFNNIEFASLHPWGRFEVEASNEHCASSPSSNFGDVPVGVTVRSAIIIGPGPTWLLNITPGLVTGNKRQGRSSTTGPSSANFQASYKTFDPDGSGGSPSGSATGVRGNVVFDPFGGMWSVDDAGRVSRFGAIYGDPTWTGTYQTTMQPVYTGGVSNNTMKASIHPNSPITPTIIANSTSGQVNGPSYDVYLTDLSGKVFKYNFNERGFPASVIESGFQRDLGWALPYVPNFGTPTTTDATAPSQSDIDANLALGANQRLSSVSVSNLLNSQGEHFIYYGSIAGEVVRLVDTKDNVLDSSSTVIGRVSEGVFSSKYVTSSPVVTTPALDSQDRVYVGTLGGKVYRLKADLSTSDWVYNVPNSDAVLASLSLDDSGNVIVAAGSKVYKLNGSTGAQIWSATTGGTIVGDMAVASNGDVYAGSTDGKLYKFAASSGTSSSFNASSPIRSSVALDSAGAVYFGTDGGTVYKLNSSLSQQWTYGVGGPVRGGLTFSGDGTLFVGSSPSSTSAGNITAIGSPLYNVKIPVVLDDYVGGAAWEYDALPAQTPRPTYNADVTQIKVKVKVLPAGSTSYNDTLYEYTGFLDDTSTPEMLLPQLPKGNYDIYVKPKGFLQKKITVNVTSNTTTSSITVLNGDINEDNHVDDFDSFIYSSHFLEDGFPPDHEDNADVNGDGFVDDFDGFILSSNYLLDGDQP